VPLDGGEHVGDGHLAAQLARQRGHAGVGDAAGHEPVVPAEVDVAVEGEAVHRHPAADPDAERRDLALGSPVVGAEPHPAAAGHPRGDDAEVGAHRDQRLLDPAHVVDDLHVVGEGHDRVADQLPRPVEGDLAAAVDVDDRGAARVGGPLVGVGPLAGGEHRRVLEQQHGVGGVARDDGGVHLALQLPGGEVVDGVGAESGDPEVQRVVLGHSRSLPLWRTSGPGSRSG
jgi:hypothetical protein